MSPSKRKLIIFDANVIIHAHEIGVWTHLINQFNICVVGIVIDDEAKYFQSNTGLRIDIDLKKSEAAKEITRLDPEIAHTQKIFKEYKELFIKGLDAGERDAITLLNSGNFEDYFFCSGDKAAIKAAAIIDKTHNAVSLEKLLTDSGQKAKINSLNHEFREKYMKQYLNTGLQERSSLKK